MAKQSVIDRLSHRMAQKERDEWICECGKHNLNGFYNCEKCGKIISEENATEEPFAHKKTYAVYENILSYLDTKGLEETVKSYGWDEIKKAIDEESLKGRTTPRHDEAERLRVESQTKLSSKEVMGQTSPESIHITRLIGGMFDTLFGKLVKTYGLKTGDVAPEQELALDDLKREVSKFMVTYVRQNKYSMDETEAQEKKLNTWNLEQVARKAQTELSDAGVPLDHVLGTVAQHFAPGFKVSVENLEQLIDDIRKVVSRPGGDFIENNREFEASKKGSRR